MAARADGVLSTEAGVFGRESTGPTSSSSSLSLILKPVEHKLDK